MWLWLSAAVTFVALCASLGYWVESGGFDCWPACTTAQKVTGALVYPFAVLFLVLVVAGLVRAVARRGRAV